MAADLALIKNPLAVEYSKNNDWLGKGVRNKSVVNGRFETFITNSDGIRAAGKLLQNYKNKYGSTTIEQLLSKYSPQGDSTNEINSTENYIKRVSAMSGIPRDQHLELKQDRDSLGKILRAMAVVENASQDNVNAYVSDEDFETALDLLVPEASRGSGALGGGLSSEAGYNFVTSKGLKAQI
jgi:hypothetical protein